ncbi:uncharacterized protein C8orf88 homolog isoform X2 [Trichomycterus rosablanca]|uniref:uncharacterized protein C8orf88 homolog isoform X2 n=1 Tax=Trichomycterus rosablanca TaxID=2290929 RepID=UPI002F351D1A
MELAQRRFRHVEPARPLRRLNINQVADSLEKPAERAVNTIRVEQFYEILKLHSQIQGPAKPAVQVRLVSDACSQVGETSKLHAERISYSRDVLISLASSPMAKKKPNFLPEHPVVLENGREQDMQQLFMNNLHKEDV